MTNKTKWEIPENNSTDALPLQTKSPPLVSSLSGMLSAEDAVPAIELGKTLKKVRMGKLVIVGRT